jgi:two-component system, NtrC family, response regulator AtoC
MTWKVLLVDDDRSVRGFLREMLSSRGYEVEEVQSGEEAMQRLGAGSTPSIILLDLLMPGMGGLEVLERAKQMNAAIPVIVVSSTGQTKTVVDAMKAGASDYLVKPFEEEELELAIANAVEKQTLREEVRRLKRQLECTDQWDLIAMNPRMQRVREVAKHVAGTDVPVLILGESGVGKEVIAKFIHEQSARKDKPMVKVNCAALPHDLLESELFGYERGAFTGALQEKPGKFELADKGFLLLDEIAEMSPQLQAKMLHVLQDGEYSRLGGKRALRSDARILALTNRRLEEAVARGEFREDLYFRLNVIKLEIPPLRERPEDIPLLCNLFFEKYREKYNRELEQLPRPLVEAFARYDWPGNVRQLENAIKKYLILPDLELVLSELKGVVVEGRVASSLGASLKEISSEAAGQAEREAVLKMLEQTGWNRKRAAQELKISYKALLNKLKKWQFDGRPRGLPNC